MTSDPEALEALAKSLTDAQRTVLNELTDYLDDGRRGARPMDVQADQGRYTAVVLKQLCAKGLARLHNWAGPTERGSCRYWILPKGSAVAALAGKGEA